MTLAQMLHLYLKVNNFICEKLCIYIYVNFLKMKAVPYGGDYLRIYFSLKGKTYSLYFANQGG